ncbi:MAG TPA: oligosaccharide flippase family protein, partial [Phormidium sp.]
MNKIWNTLRELRQKSLARDSFWMLLSQCFGIVFQTFYFIFVARSLGVQEYGAFVGAQSLANIVTPFSGWGGSHLIFKNVSKDKDSFTLYLGNALILIGASAPLLIGLTVLLSPLVFSGKVSVTVVFFAFVADLIGIKLTEVATSSLLSTGSAKYAALIGLLTHASKLIAVLIFNFLFPNRGVETWAFLYCLTSLLTASAAILFVISRLGVPRFEGRGLIADLRQGFYFSISGFSDSINSSLDQTMLASLSTLKATGTYNAAGRFVGMALVFLISFSGATYSRFFQHGTTGILGSWRFAKKLLPLAIGYGLLVFLSFMLLAPLVPYVLGADYRDSIPVLRWFAPLIPIISLNFLAADSLTGAGHQG